MFEHYKFEYDKNDLELKNDKNDTIEGYGH